MRFQPGNKCGKGRPKGSGYIGACEQWAETKGWQRLIDIADGKPLFRANGRTGKLLPADSKLQFEALKTILAYGVGKPRESVAPVETFAESMARLNEEMGLPVN